MTNLLTTVRSVLEQAGYRTIGIAPASTSLQFEDDSVLGIIYASASLQNLVEEWKENQDTFLRESSSRLLTDPLKAWNCYTVLLSSQPAKREDASILFQIEEDFRGSRKIVRAGVTTRDDVESALAPLLPLRRVLPLQAEDVKRQLATRLGEPGSPILGLLSKVEANTLAASLIGGQ